MAERRARIPNEGSACRVARALYEDLDTVVWIPSDDADVFRLSFTSDRRPRILKMAIPGVRAVWREVAAFPAMRRLGVSEMPEFEHSSEDRADFGVDFHVTRELVNPEGAGRAMAELWAHQRGRALEVAEWLGDLARRIESLDWRGVPRANSPEGSVAIGAEWWRPEYARLGARSDCPDWARALLDRLSEESSRPPNAFGGWGGELLQASDGSFVPIDWPGLGAAPPGSLAAAALEVLLRFRAADPGPLAQRFLAGWRPDGLDDGGLDDLRLWWAHHVLWWAAWNLGHDSDPDPDLAEVYARVWTCLNADEPARWLRPAPA